MNSNAGRGNSLQEAHNRDLAVAMESQRAIVAKPGGQPNHGEGSGIFQGVGQMLVCLAGHPTSCGCTTSPEVFGQALTESDGARDGQNDRYDDFVSAGPVGLVCGVPAIGEEHTEGHV